MSISPHMTPARRGIFCLGLVILFGFGGFDLVGNADLASSADLIVC